MKSKIIAILMLGVAMAALVSAATTELRTYRTASTLLVSGAAADDVTWTLSHGAVKPVSALFTYNTAVTSTVSVAILRNGTNQVIGAGTYSGTTFAVDLSDRSAWMHWGEALVINAGVTNASLIAISMENPQR